MVRVQRNALRCDGVAADWIQRGQVQVQPRHAQVWPAASALSPHAPLRCADRQGCPSQRDTHTGKQGWWRHVQQAGEKGTALSDTPYDCLSRCARAEADSQHVTDMRHSQHPERVAHKRAVDKHL
eukprot:3250806-Prymnesium_polylepis.2